MNIETTLKERVCDMISTEFFHAQKIGSVQGIEKRIEDKTKEIYATMGAEYFSKFRFYSHFDEHRQETVIGVSITPLELSLNADKFKEGMSKCNFAKG